MIKTHNVCTKMSLFYNVKEILAHTTTGSFIEPFGYYMYQVWSKNLLGDIINFCKLEVASRLVGLKAGHSK